MKRHSIPWEPSPVSGWMWKVFPKLVMWAKDSWMPFGLSMDTLSINPPLSVVECSEHDLVADYLRRHPEIRAQYKADQTGVVKYYNVLSMAKVETAVEN